MARFKEFFATPQMFSNGAIVLDGSYTESGAIDLISKELVDFGLDADLLDPEHSCLERERVRFGFAPDTVEDRDSFDNSPIWYTGASGKGSKEIWILNCE